MGSLAPTQNAGCFIAMLAYQRVNYIINLYHGRAFFRLPISGLPPSHCMCIGTMKESICSRCTQWGCINRCSFVNCLPSVFCETMGYVWTGSASATFRNCLLKLETSWNPLDVSQTSQATSWMHSTHLCWSMIITFNDDFVHGLCMSRASSRWGKGCPLRPWFLSRHP